MGVRVVEADTSDSYDEDCSTCCSGSSSTSSSSRKSSVKKQIKNSTLKPENLYYYDDGKAEILHPTATKSSSSSNTTSSSSNTTTSSNTSSSTAQPPYQHCAKDLVGNCKEFRIELNRHNLRIIGNGNRVRIAHNIGNLQVIGNNTKLKIVQNSGELRYTGNDGRIYLGSESQQQSVDYIGCNGILKVVNSAELQTKSKPSKSSCDKKPKSAPAKDQRSYDILPKFKSAVGDNARLQMHANNTHVNSSGNASSIHLLNNVHHDRVVVATLPQVHLPHANKIISGNTGLPQRPQNGASLPNINLNASCAQFANKENRFEIRNNLTVVNNVDGNIVIKNAINVSI